MVLRENWNIGILEYWNIAKSKKGEIPFLPDPLFHYSILPLLQFL
jgi:hypothetical protein